MVGSSPASKGQFSLISAFSAVNRSKVHCRAIQFGLVMAELADAKGGYAATVQVRVLLLA